MRLGILIVLLAIGLNAQAARRCGDHLEDQDVTRYDVLNLCGAPDWQDSWNWTESTGVWSPIQNFNSVFIEQWYYNRGPDRLLRLYTFHNLRLVKIDTLGYGWEPRRRRKCKPDIFPLGMSKYEVWFHCGDPAWAESWDGGQVVRPGPGLARFSQVHFDTWIYDFGTSRFQRILYFQNGFLNFKEIGERGHLRHKGL